MKRKHLLQSSMAGFIAAVLLVTGMAVPSFAAEAEPAAEDPENGIVIELNSEVSDEDLVFLQETEEEPEDAGEQTLTGDSNPFDFVDEDARLDLLEAEKTFPSAFDQRYVDTDGDGYAENYVTPVKLQNPFGTCWGFAAISAAETSILGTIHQEDVQANDGPDSTPFSIDLSEKQLAYFSHKYLDDPANPQNGEGTHNDSSTAMSSIYTGGTTFLATSVFAQGIGPTQEVADSETGKYFTYNGMNREVEFRYLYNKNEGQYGYYPFGYSAFDDWTIPESYRFVQDFVLKESSLLPSPAEKDVFNNYTYNEAATAVIKDELMQLHGVEIAFCADQSAPDPNTNEATYLNENTWAHYTWNPEDSANHAVQIVGWDDNFSKDNFVSAHKPPADGAWLVKNSWGAGTEEFPNYAVGNWGIQEQLKDTEGNPLVDEEGNPITIGTGYFWISYYDTSMKFIETFVFDRANTEEGYYLDEYDYLPASDMKASVSESPVKMSNIFTADYNEELDAVSVVTTTPGTEVTIEVYLLKNNYTSPTDGVLAASTTDSYTYGGFHKAYLNDFTQKGFVLQQDSSGSDVLPVQKGQSYSVIVTQKRPDNQYNVTMASGYGEKNELVDLFFEGSYQKSVINQGESLLWFGGEWQDLSDINVQAAASGVSKETIEESDLQYDNFPIKGFCNVKPEANDVNMYISGKTELILFEGQDTGTINLRFSGNAAAQLSNAEISYALAEGGEDILEITPNPNGVSLKAKALGSTDLYITVKGIGTTVIPVNVGRLCVVSVLCFQKVFEYTGKEIEPEIIVNDSAKKILVKDVDYTVKYKNNILAGVGEAEITPAEKYQEPGKQETISTHFVIAPPAVKLLKSEPGATTIKLTVTDQKDLGISGYAVAVTETATGKELEPMLFGPESNELLLEGLKPETKYDIMVSGYVAVPQDLADSENMETINPGMPLSLTAIATTKEIKIKSVTLPAKKEVGTKKTLQLKATLNPADTSQKGLTWTSSDESIAKVDKDGKVTGVTRGTATITATSTADKSLKASCKVTVLYSDAMHSNVDDEMFSAIYWAADKKITGEKVTFGTKNSMTRGQFVRFLYRYAGNPKVTSTMIKKYGSQFKDVDSSYTHYNAIVWAVSKGLIGGYSDGSFKPEKPLSRNNVATILWKFAGEPKVSNAKNPFTDVAKSAALAWGKSKKIFTGTKFQPKNNCLRGDFAVFLYRYDKKVGK